MPPATSVPDATLAELLARYDAFLLDAYGVLNDADGPLAGAAGFLERLVACGKPYCVISNDASRSVEATCARYRSFGLSVDEARIVTSGVLLRAHFHEAGLKGSPCIVLGTEDAQDYVRAAGGHIVPPTDEAAEVVVVADDAGYPLLPTLNQVVTVLLRRLSRAQETHLVVPNPDLVYPSREGFGLTAGAFANLIESVLDLRMPGGAPRFTRLGKPFAPIYAEGMARLGLDPARAQDRQRVVMIGDQLLTDVRGARAFGLDAALVLTGVSTREDVARFATQLGITPTWILQGL